MKNENLIEYNRIVKGNLLNKNPYYKDDDLNSEIDKFLAENEEFQLILERNKKRKDKLKEGKILEDKEPRYLKLYLDDLSNILDLGPKQKNLILSIFELGFVSIKGHIELNSKRKKILAKKLNQKDFSNYYKVLKQLQIPLIELNNTPIIAPISYDDDFDDGIERYYINPFILGNGSWANVKNRRLRIVLDYQGDNRRITVENLAKLDDFETQTETNDTNEEETWLDKKPDYSDFDDEVNF